MDNIEQKFEEALVYIHSFEKFGWVLGLERIGKLLELLGNPQKDLKFIHIAGTNGKGSTTMFCSNILIESGYKVGTYTSPFVVDFRERFQIDLQMISKEEFVELVETIKPIVKEMAQAGDIVTEFEVITTIAFLYFKKHKCDIVCLEVGLGGNFDATNIIDTPLISIITSIAMDHTHILGDTIKKIAGEKAGIIKQNGICVTYPKQDIEALEVFMERCALTNSKFIQANANAIEILNSDIYGSKFKFNNEDYEISMALKHQVYNAVNVITAMEQLTTKGYNVKIGAIKKGLKKTKFLARFEIISKEPLIIIDGAHNFQGVSALSEKIKEIKADRKTAIMGMLSDKDFSASLEKICDVVDKIICVPVNNPRGLNEEDLLVEAKKYTDKAIAFGDLEKAYEHVKSTLNKNDAVIICGSLYMVGDMRKIVIKDTESGNSHEKTV